MRFFYFLLFTFLITACGSYKYYQPTANPVLFREKAEVHVSGEIGSSGASAKTGFSISDNLAFYGQYNSGFTEYRSKEGEIGFGYFKPAEPKGVFIGGGVGFGNNFKYEDSTFQVKTWKGDFIRPFAQINYGVSGGTIFKGLKGDLVMTGKVNYFMFDGQYLSNGETLNSRYWTFEPSFTAALGSRVVRFEMIYGFPIHFRWIDMDKPLARTFPMNISVGMHLVIGREKE